METEGLSRVDVALRERARELAGTSFPVDVCSLLRERGFSVARRELVGSEALLVGNVVYLKYPEPKRAALKRRERFTLAHELGHVEIKKTALDLGIDPDRIPKAKLEAFCDDFAAELLAPTPFVESFIANRLMRLRKRGAALPHRVLGELASACETSVAVACRAVCRASSSHLIVCLGLVDGRKQEKCERQALGVKWSSFSEHLPLGLFLNKRIPDDHTFVRAFRRRRALIGVAYLDLPPLKKGYYEVEFRPYRKDEYLLSIAVESFQWSPEKGHPQRASTGPLARD